MTKNENAISNPDKETATTKNENYFLLFVLKMKCKKHQQRINQIYVLCLKSMQKRSHPRIEINFNLRIVNLLKNAFKLAFLLFKIARFYSDLPEAC